MREIIAQQEDPTTTTKSHFSSRMWQKYNRRENRTKSNFFMSFML